MGLGALGRVLAGFFGTAAVHFAGLLVLAWAWGQVGHAGEGGWDAVVGIGVATVLAAAFAFVFLRGLMVGRGRGEPIVTGLLLAGLAIPMAALADFAANFCICEAVPAGPVFAAVTALGYVAAGTLAAAFPRQPKAAADA